jgi:epoxyqueuosine reductase
LPCFRIFLMANQHNAPLRPTAPDPAALAQALKRAARARGFQLAGVAEAVDLPEDLRRLERWLEAGRQGQMAWMEREPDRRADVRRSLPEARSILMLGMNYFQGERVENPPEPVGWGRIARYARGSDYHDLIGERLELLAQDAADLAGRAVASRAFVDASPLLERAYAERAGLGFIGKNGCLIAPGLGSWVFLAGLALDLVLPPDDPLSGTCGRCSRCLTACPTDAFPAPWELDARRCISYLTIENRDPIEDESLTRGLGDWAFGCDVCQDVCPYNKKAPATDEAAFLGPAFVDLRALLAIKTNREFNQGFLGSPLQRARRKGLQRTAAHLLANQLEAASASPQERAAMAGSLEKLASEETENPALANSFRDAAEQLRNAP